MDSGAPTSLRLFTALAKVHAHALPDGGGAHGFRTLLGSLSAIVRSMRAIPCPDCGKAETMIEVATRPGAEQERALTLLKDIAKM